MCLRFNQFHIVKTFQSPDEKHNIPCTSNIYFLGVAWPEMCQEEGFKGADFIPLACKQNTQDISPRLGKPVCNLAFSSSQMNFQT